MSGSKKETKPSLTAPSHNPLIWLRMKGPPSRWMVRTKSPLKPNQPTITLFSESWRTVGVNGNGMLAQHHEAPLLETPVSIKFWLGDGFSLIPVTAARTSGWERERKQRGPGISRAPITCLNGRNYIVKFQAHFFPANNDLPRGGIRVFMRQKSSSVIWPTPETWTVVI